MPCTQHDRSQDHRYNKGSITESLWGHQKPRM